MTGFAAQQPLTATVHKTSVKIWAVIALIAAALLVGAFYTGRVTASDKSPTLGSVTVNTPNTDPFPHCLPYRPC